MSDEEKLKIKDIIAGLMLSDHLGDVLYEINRLCEMIGEPKREGYHNHWTEADKELWRELSY